MASGVRHVLVSFPIDTSTFGGRMVVIGTDLSRKLGCRCPSLTDRSAGRLHTRGRQQRLAAHDHGLEPATDQFGVSPLDHRRL